MPVEIGSQNEYGKADPIDDADLNESMTERNESILEYEELLHRFHRTK